MSKFGPDIILGYDKFGKPLYQCEGRFPNGSPYGERCPQMATQARTAFTGYDFETMHIVKFRFCDKCAAEWDIMPPEATGDEEELVEDEDGYIF